jgi:hypothetical protein
MYNPHIVVAVQSAKFLYQLVAAVNHDQTHVQAARYCGQLCYVLVVYTHQILLHTRERAPLIIFIEEPINAHIFQHSMQTTRPISWRLNRVPTDGPSTRYHIIGYFLNIHRLTFRGLHINSHHISILISPWPRKPMEIQLRLLDHMYNTRPSLASSIS